MFRVSRLLRRLISAAHSSLCSTFKFCILPKSISPPTFRIECRCRWRRRRGCCSAERTHRRQELQTLLTCLEPCLSLDRRETDPEQLSVGAILCGNLGNCVICLCWKSGSGWVNPQVQTYSRCGLVGSIGPRCVGLQSSGWRVCVEL